MNTQSAAHFGRISKTMTNVRRGAMPLLLAILLASLVFSPPLYAGEQEETSGTSQLVIGAASFILTPVYGAFKLAFAGAGAIVGGLTWVFTGGDEQAAQRVWDASLKGTYIITPDHLAGDKQVYFVGPDND